MSQIRFIDLFEGYDTVRYCLSCGVHFANPNQAQSGNHSQCTICGSACAEAPCKPNGELTRIISATGSHGVGKTTTVFDLARRLKLLLPNKTIGILSENAAFSPYPINKQTSPESQMWIFANQIQAELHLLSKYDIVVSDRTALDSVAYSYAAGFDQMADAMYSMYLCHKHIYGIIFFKTVKNNNYLVEDGIRDGSDKTFQQKVEDILLDLYAKSETGNVTLV